VCGTRCKSTRTRSVAGAITLSDEHFRFVAAIRSAWGLVPRHERRQLKLISLYGLLIAGLDTFALLLIYALINLLSNQGATGYAEKIIDLLNLDPSDHYRTALVLLGITAGLFITRSVLSILGIWLSLGIVYSAEAKLLARLLIGHAYAPQLMRLERNSSETLRTVLDSTDRVMNGVVFSSVTLLANVAVAVAVALGLFLSSPTVAITITIYFTLVAVGWIYGVRNGLARQGRRAQQLQQERYQLVLQGIAATKELQLRGRSVVFAREASAATRGILAAMRVANVTGQSLRYVLETSLVFGAVLVVAAAGLTGGRATVLPAVGLVLAGAFRLVPALNQVLYLTNAVQFAGPAIGFVTRELETFGSFADQERESEALDAPLRLQKELRLENVGFSYPTRPQPVLRDVSLLVRPGESLGIVGPTGTGKSTLLDIILGMLDPERGSVTVDGAPLGERRGAWQLSIGYVPQDVYLIDDSLRANVALGWLGDDIDDERVVEAVRLAGLEEVVAALPDQFETVLGERGIRLSGGQRQRVGIARALYTQPSVLVLDEATSNLDQSTEHRIVDTLASLHRGGVTMIVVTHRTASVRHCDQIVYLEDGRVRSAGTFDEIKAAVPEFDEPFPAKVAFGG
jgi:ABC-type multidrug transport system fused ATPase/permease subunit